MIRALDGDGLDPGTRRREPREVVGWAVLVSRACHHQSRHPHVLEEAEVGHRQRRGDQRDSADPTVTAGDQRGDPRAERVPGDRERAAIDGLRHHVESRRGVVLLADPAPVSSAGSADPPEIEAQRRQTSGGAHLLNTYDDRIFHVAAVQRVGMANDDTGSRGRGHSEERLEAQIGRNGHAYRLFGYHVPP